MSTAANNLSHDTLPSFPEPAVSPKLLIALGCNLISWLFLVLAACLLPALIGIAAGLFFFVGVPLALVSLSLLIACTCLLAGNKARPKQWIHYGVVVSTVCGWIAHLCFVVTAVLLLGLLMNS